jgi:hypothetical protein
MKISPKSLFATFIISCIFIKCNDAEPKKEVDIVTPASGSSKNETAVQNPNNNDDCTGISNFLVTEEDAKEMIKNFRKTFNINRMELPYWIDSCTIFSLKRFFDVPANKDIYDGVRIHLGANAFDSEIFLTVTKKIDTVHHQDDFEKFVPLPSTCVPNYINVKRETRERKIKRYRENYRGETPGGGDPTAKIKHLSRAVWISKCVIDALCYFLQDPSNGLDGIHIYNAAYSRLMNVEGQEYPNQSTYIIVVTKPDNAGYHRDDWSVLKDNKYEALYSEINAYEGDGGGYNHGQLCPNICQ